ncbi:hypothetical protein [Lederbergia citri]|uniref:Uncharacterized protein n=1 Tax=Lederbergia citri TaxID=2833580 RepID=A0A942TFI2_9BACI|nr:hypothetical protein [Lederbergia citri]MBS4196995.1 hypothetical protein [Lederbergia citri]
MENSKEKKLPFIMWLSAVIGAFIFFFIAKVIWEDVHLSLLVILLLMGFFINLLISLFFQKKKIPNNDAIH